MTDRCRACTSSRSASALRECPAPRPRNRPPLSVSAGCGPPCPLRPAPSPCRRATCSKLQNGADGADLIDIVRSGVVLGGIALGDQEDFLSSFHDGFQRPDGLFAARRTAARSCGEKRRCPAGAERDRCRGYRCPHGWPRLVSDFEGTVTRPRSVRIQGQRRAIDRKIWRPERPDPSSMPGGAGREPWRPRDGDTPSGVPPQALTQRRRADPRK